MQQRTAEQIVDVPQFPEETVEVMRLVPRERVQWIDEEMVEVPPVPPVGATEALQSQIRAISQELLRKFFNMFSTKEAGLAKMRKLAHCEFRNQGSWARSEEVLFSACGTLRRRRVTSQCVDEF